MEAEPADRSKTASLQQRDSALSWYDLRGWIAQIEQHGELARIAASVDPDEEIGAVTLLASRQDKSPALIFESLKGDTTGSRILINMLGATRERYALAVGLDPSAHARNDPVHAIADDRSDPASDDREGPRAGQ
jgi:UbiD family decarboxylase